MSNTTNTLAVQMVPQGAPSLSGHLADITDWGDSPFIDLAKSARGWRLGNPVVDIHGHLTSSDQTVSFFLSSRGDDGVTDFTDMNGTCRIRWTDNGSGATLVERSRVTIVSQGTVVGDGYDREAIVTITFDGNVEFDFSCTHATNRPRDVRAIREAQLSAYEGGQIFNPDMLDLLRGKMEALRFMWWCQVWGYVLRKGDINKVVDWSDWTTEASQTWQRVPVSVQCKLCNELGMDMWFNNPVTATDACMTAAAQEIENTLDPARICIVEFSNENWNPDLGGIEADIEASTVAEWPATGPTPTFNEQMSWCSKRAVDMKNLFHAVSSSRFKYVLAGWRDVNSANVEVLDAPEWQAQSSGTYVKPHKQFDYFSVADYFGKEGLSANVLAQFDADYDSGDLTAAKDAMDAFYRAEIETTKGELDAVALLLTGADSIDGELRSLKHRAYEGGSNHTVLTIEADGRTFTPIAWAQGVVVSSDEYRKNQHGRIYKATNSGTTGATEPTHTAANTVSDGAVTWLDITGEVIASSGSYEIRADAANSDALNTTVANVQAYSAKAWVVDEYLQNSNGTVYQVTTGGTASQEPTHTSGTQTVGGVEYRAVTLVTGQSNPRPEVLAWLSGAMMDADMGQHITQLFEHQKSLGFESPMIFTLDGRNDEAGYFASFLRWTDTGPGANARGDVLLGWSMANPKWW